MPSPWLEVFQHIFWNSFSLLPVPQAGPAEIECILFPERALFLQFLQFSLESAPLLRNAKRRFFLSLTRATGPAPNSCHRGNFGGRLPAFLFHTSNLAVPLIFFVFPVFYLPAGELLQLFGRFPSRSLKFGCSTLGVPELELISCRDLPPSGRTHERFILPESTVIYRAVASIRSGIQAILRLFCCSFRVF